MHGYVSRAIEHNIKGDLKQFPAVAILGPRQCGKSTTAQEIGKRYSNFIYLDLERPSDQRKLRDPELFFNSNQAALICLDEIQRVPNIFPVLRSIIDQNKRPGQFLILGSASRDLLKQSSETLAGRIAYNELTPFVYSEISADPKMSIQQYWLRGGFPNSLLTDSNTNSARWRENFIRTYLERDIPQMGFNITAESLRRLWTMCAHYHGQMLNASELANALNISSTTVRSHLDILEQTFTVRLLKPYINNTKKRLVKSPKLYIRDSGLVHELLEVRDINNLLAHPRVGASWEGLVLENIITTLPQWRPSFYRTTNGAEIDLVLERGQTSLAFEFKAASNPDITRGFYSAIEDIGIEQAWVVVPTGDASPVNKQITISNLQDCLVILAQRYL
ncbi:MAG: hypothetical protein ACD_43C00163G0001 [uncultured bacterium]|nr:MAG: hypothetical protein ACD_43C00163G0001 [uncultured bacterium]